MYFSLKEKNPTAILVLHKPENQIYIRVYVGVADTTRGRDILLASDFIF